MAPAPSPSVISALLRGVRGAGQSWAARPAGPLVWMHLPLDIPEEALESLKAALPDINVLTTYAGLKVSADYILPLPAPRRAAIDAFLQHWKPDLVLWGAPENGLAEMRRAKRAGIKMLYASLSGQPLPSGMKGRQLTEFLQGFERILLENEAEKARFLHLEAPGHQIIACKPLSEVAVSLPESHGQLRRLSAALGPRPVWCAYGVSRGEVTALLAAHRHAVRAIPNLLLVIVPRAAEEVISGQIQAEGWRMARYSDEGLPDRQIEVLVDQAADNHGVWMRLATVTYAGGTLFGPEAADPFAPVALGSALLCGVNTAPYSGRYQRLVKAGAVIEVESKAALGAKLVLALAPDYSAQIALKAWEVGSEGAEAVATLSREILALLERKGT